MLTHITSAWAVTSYLLFNPKSIINFNVKVKAEMKFIMYEQYMMINFISAFTYLRIHSDDYGFCWVLTREHVVYLGGPDGKT